MPLNPLDMLKNLHIGESQQLSPEEQAAQDANAQAQQAGDPTWKKMGRAAVDGVAGFTKGLTGLGDQGPGGATATNLGQVVGAGLPLLNKGGLIEALRGAAPAAEASQFFTPANYAADNAFVRAQGGQVAHGMSDAAHELPKSNAYQGLLDTIKRSNAGEIAQPGMLSPAATRAATLSGADIFNPATAQQMQGMYEKAAPTFQGMDAKSAFGGDRSVGGLHGQFAALGAQDPYFTPQGSEGIFNAGQPKAPKGKDAVEAAYSALLARGGR